MKPRSRCWLQAAVSVAGIILLLRLVWWPCDGLRPQPGAAAARGLPSAASSYSAGMPAATPECLKTLWGHLPISGGQVMWHHWVPPAPGAYIWNGERRHDDPIPGLQAPCTVWYPGGHKDGADGKRIQKAYGCAVDVFEPVPPFAKILERNWQDVPLSRVHHFGLGASNRFMEVDPGLLDGEATFVMDGSDGSGSGDQTRHLKGRKPGGLKMEIRDVGQVFRELRSTKAGRGGGTSSNIDLLHVNCEGCEYELFETLHRRKLLGRFRTIQFSFHAISAVPGFMDRYCQIRAALSETHDIAFGKDRPFEWERWVLKDS